MHPKAMDKIWRTIQDALNSCIIKHRWPQYSSYFEQLESLAQEILKHKSEWLRESDIYSIFIDYVVDSLIKKYPDETDLTGNLKDLLSTEKLVELVDSISAFLNSIPRQYDIYLPLPAVNDVDFGSLDLQPGVSLKTFSKVEDIPGGYKGGFRGALTVQLEKDKAYFCISAKGYSGGSLDNLCMRDALTNFKVLLHAGIFRDVFVLEEKRPLSLGLLGGFGHYQIPKISTISIDLMHPEKRVISTELTLNMTRFIHKVCIHRDAGFIKNAMSSGNDKLKSVIQAVFKKPAQLISIRADEVDRIKSAIEWAIDSNAEENKTLAFIQNCIGLEAILGDDLGDMPITATLADRCSYLIGSDLKGRKTIRDKFKKLYQIRSNLVHGKVSRLKDDSAEYYHWGKSVLDISIAQEIKNLKTDEK